jgi:hypothetical protein
MTTSEAASSVVERWILTSSDQALIMAKHPANRLGFAMLLIFFRDHGRFPRHLAEINPATVHMIAQQIAVARPAGDILNLSARTVERHRAEIRTLLGFWEATVADADGLGAWLQEQIATAGTDLDSLVVLLEAQCRALLIEPPTADRVNRIVRAAIRAQDERFYAGIRDRLAPETRIRLEALLRPADGAAGSDETGANRLATMAPAVLLRLRGSPGRPSLASIQNELAKLEVIRAIGLPTDLFDRLRPQDLERYQRRVAAEAPYELRRHPEPARLTWLGAFVHLRGRTLIDDLVDLLIETVHRIGARAERRVERDMLNDLRRVAGKPNLLFDVAGAALEQPDGTVRDVVCPVIGEQTLRDLVKEGKATGPAYRTTLRTVIRNSYKGHYRRMVPQLLEKLEFRSNNDLDLPGKSGEPDLGEKSGLRKGDILILRLQEYG